jgi:hypothetical protein
MPDYDPGREGHVEHRFIVQRAWPGRGALDIGESVKTDRGELKFDEYGRFMVKDEALARRIQEEYPREVAVTRVRYPSPADRGHRYFFGQMPEMPWKRKKGEE